MILCKLHTHDWNCFHSTDTPSRQIYEIALQIQTVWKCLQGYIFRIGSITDKFRIRKYWMSICISFRTKSTQQGFFLIQFLMFIGNYPFYLKTWDGCRHWQNRETEIPVQGHNTQFNDDLSRNAEEVVSRTKKNKKNNHLWLIYSLVVQIRWRGRTTIWPAKDKIKASNFSD